MKKIILSILITSAMLSACDDPTTDHVSRTTFFPDFEFMGDEIVVVPKGGTYEEPGVTATESGEPIEVTTSAVGTYFGGTTLDTNSPDRCTITYSAYNSDGFAGTRQRQVIVAPEGDLVTNIEGLYRATVVRNNVSGAQYTNMEYVFIRKTGDNTYEISDALAGYYDLGRSIGRIYATPRSFTANDIPGNDFDFGAAFPINTFGGVASITDMEVNPATKTINFTTIWQADASTTYLFENTLVQVQL